MLSRFLPADFDATRPVAVIAGNGVYPVLTVAALRRANVPVRLIGVIDDTDPELLASFAGEECRTLHPGQVGLMLETLRAFHAAYAIMAGQVTPTRLFSGLRPDAQGAALLARLQRRNAETIFGAIAAEIEAIGVRMLDARAFLDEELATAGWMTRQLEPLDERYVQHGVQIAREMARLDVGQSVVVREGTVIAVEAFEGTDAMLRRAGAFNTNRLIFVKTVKPRQDFRFDVPVLGRQTLQIMREAKITTAVVEAGSTLILEKEAVQREAEAAGIQLFGFAAAQPMAG